MAQIHVLDSETIDKIAAGEVVERPSSVVKELVENAIDAGAGAITVEARDGGIEFLRITDNGCGMESSQIRSAFLRHATSKISSAKDLSHISSLGFRGEALSSIAAVSKVEVITKTSEELMGVRYVIEGAVEKAWEEVGAPNGTTFIMRNLFYNTPVRRKFLKQPATEGGYISELMEHLAFSRPDISFKFVLNNQLRFHTSGNGDLKEVIYRIWGRDVANHLVPIQTENNGIRIEGYLGKPILLRSNRNFEIYFVNGRYIRSQLLSRSIEEGYKEYLMQHKFPLCVLHFTVENEWVDVNVHPTKMDVRFADAPAFTGLLTSAIKDTLARREMIPEVCITDPNKVPVEKTAKESIPEPYEQIRTNLYRMMEESKYQSKPLQMQDNIKDPIWNKVPREMSDQEEIQQSAQQITLFDEKMISMENRSRYQLIGQIFDTYWLIQFEDKLLIVDQHAAHEKIKYERLMKQYHEKQVLSQGLMPPVIVSLTGQEEAVLNAHFEIFTSMGFDVEFFGGNEYTIRSVPVELYGCGEKQMFLEVLDSLSEGSQRSELKSIEEKIASMSCKSAVKGNQSMSRQEAEELIDELLLLDNPYHCPHGRPTIISMTQMELEKKFKRIV